MKQVIKSLKKFQGFTLVELMVVIAIIGILSAVAIPNFKKYKEKAKMTEVKVNLSTMYTGLIGYEMDNDTYTGATLTAIGYPQGPNNKFAIGFGTSASTCDAGTTRSCDQLTRTGLQNSTFSAAGIGMVNNTACSVRVDQDKGMSYTSADTSFCQ